MDKCSYLAASSHHGPAAIRCDEHAVTMVRDQRPLPDGKLRPAVPACAGHAAVLVGTGNYKRTLTTAQRSYLESHQVGPIAVDDVTDAMGNPWVTADGFIIGRILEEGTVHVIDGSNEYVVSPNGEYLDVYVD